MVLYILRMFVPDTSCHLVFNQFLPPCRNSWNPSRIPQDGNGKARWIRRNCNQKTIHHRLGGLIVSMPRSLGVLVPLLVSDGSVSFEGWTKLESFIVDGPKRFSIWYWSNDMTNALRRNCKLNMHKSRSTTYPLWWSASQDAIIEHATWMIYATYIMWWSWYLLHPGSWHDHDHSKIYTYLFSTT